MRFGYEQGDWSIFIGKCIKSFNGDHDPKPTGDYTKSYTGDILKIVRCHKCHDEGTAK